MLVDLIEGSDMTNSQRVKNNAKIYRQAILLLNKPKTKNKGIILLKTLSRGGYEKAKLALVLENITNPEIMTKNAMIECLNYFHKQGEKKATLNLGYCYDQGIGVKKNYSKAFKLYKDAAHSGLPDAQWNLALFYENGIGCRKDLKEAFKWYKKASLNGDAESINSLGYCYKYGIGIKKNYSKAIELFRKAARKGSPSAFSNLGSMYLSGFGVKKSLKKATKYLVKGANLGSELAKKLLLELKIENNE